MKTIDCRGLACPGPVIQAKKTMEGMGTGTTFAIEVDSEAGRENVLRFARGKGASVSVENLEGNAFRLTIKPGKQSLSMGIRSSAAVFITSDRLGRGDDKLGTILMEGFVSTLVEQDTTPDVILMMNSGVRLAIEGSPVLDSMRVLADRGCEILVCGTCLDFFSLKEKLAAGAVSNMFEIQAALLHASTVIRP
ncbi:MAG: sulfurtransferase-like selenium metabolism protein YedF [Deltaproteobacteria bacterium]|nr:sulfurtransferase-like selenium metabolism protein YedF [Deltaproteobacteria bacterium]